MYASDSRRHRHQDRQRTGTGVRIGLVGCVKSKRAQPAPARDLYTSPLFRGARRFVERTCDRWFVLSAEYGLVAPETLLEPYERTLTTASPSERRQWAERVLGQLERELGRDLSPYVFELHAGRAYLDHGLVRGILERGGRVERPLHGLGLGARLAFYRERGCL
ncbi:MAG: hypothetical protein QN210_07440 [Armatimonadota bacterium]|nr:hypothetical protein [Armatimonadota bacterium]